MTRQEARRLDHGVYCLFWKGGGSSVASVGSLHDGSRWFAPSNWTSAVPTGIASTDWRRVNHTVLIEDQGDGGGSNV